MLQSTHTEKSRQSERREVDIRQYLWVILRHKWLVLAVFFINIAITLFYLSRTVPMYKTSVKILIGEEKGELSLFRELDFLGQAKLAEQMETYCELLSTHQLMRKVVENLELHETTESSSRSFWGKLLRSNSTADQVGASEELKIRRATEELQDVVQVEPVRNTRIVKVTVSGADPGMTTDTANEIASVFIDYNLQSMVGEAKSAHNFISEQLKVVQSKLRKAEEDLRKFKEEQGVVELTEEAKITLEKLSAIETSYNTTIAQRQEAEARRDATRKELEAQAAIIQSSTTIVENPLVQKLKGQLYDSEAELAGLLKVYSENTPEVEQVKTKISQTKERLAEEVERVVTSEVSSVNPVHQSLVSRLIQLEADVIAYGAMAEAQKTFVEQYKVELEQLPSKELQLARLTRDRNVSDQTYMMLIQRKEEAQLAQAIKVSNVSVADPAVRPLRPYRPQKKLSLMLGGMLGLILGLGFAFLLEYMDNTIRTEDDVKRYLEMPVLGSVPVIRSRPRAVGNPVKLSEQESKMLVHFFGKAPEVESYRMLNTNIQFGGIDNPIHTLMITSSTPREGKTTTAANLGITMAQSGKRTLLVDADMPKPTVHKLFRLEKEPGLADLFLGEAEVQDIIRNSQIDNLSVITAGSRPPNSSQLLASQKMADFIEELQELYEIILFDSAPVTVVTDPVVLGSRLDAVCLVVDSGSTNRDIALKAKELLANVGANLLGVILNKVDFRKGYGNYHYYNYYYYYYEDDRENGRRRKKRRRRA